MKPRGLRNNNPGNIRIGQAWNGLADNPSDKSFCTFECATYGIRALTLLLLKYNRPEEFKGYGLDTVYKIINRYAPSQENSTDIYVSIVARAMSVDPHQVINLKQPTLLENMIKAIIKHENGSCPYTYEITDGMLLAGVKL